MWPCPFSIVYPPNNGRHSCDVGSLIGILTVVYVYLLIYCAFPYFFFFSSNLAPCTDIAHCSGSKQKHKQSGLLKSGNNCCSNWWRDCLRRSCMWPQLLLVASRGWAIPYVSALGMPAHPEAGCQPRWTKGNLASDSRFQKAGSDCLVMEVQETFNDWQVFQM